MSCLVLSCLVLSCLALQPLRLILSCLVFDCLVLACLGLSCLVVLSSFASACLVLQHTRKSSPPWTPPFFLGFNLCTRLHTVCIAILCFVQKIYQELLYCFTRTEFLVNVCAFQICLHLRLPPPLTHSPRTRRSFVVLRRRGAGGGGS